MSDDKFQKELVGSIMRIRMKSVFFGTLALFMKVREMNEAEAAIIRTAATDGRELIFCKEFWYTMSRDEQDGVMLHEILHAALSHCTRIGTRERRLWNIAADIVVNGIVIDTGLKIPKGCFIDDKLAVYSTEEVYDILNKMSEEEKKNKFGSGNEDMFGDILDALEGLSNSDKEKVKSEIEKHWAQAIEKAKVMNQMQCQGKLPAGMEREIGNLEEAQLDWRTYLWRFVVRSRNDFAGFDRRMIGYGLYVEDLEDETIKVKVCVDTSGSISGDIMDSFLSEVAGICKAYIHIDLEMYYADADVYGPYRIEGKKRLPQPVGGGGTDFRPFFKKVKEDDRNSSNGDTGILVYLTDGYGTFPEPEDVEASILWVVIPGGLTNDGFPLGEVARLSK